MPRIREAQAKDLPRILALYRELGDREQHSDVKRYLPVFRRIKRDRTQRLLVLEDIGQVVGTVVVIIVDNLTRGGGPGASWRTSWWTRRPSARAMAGC
jgi:L-amino acid N-acyltransferase YncA